MKSNEILRWCEYVRGMLPEEESRRCDELLRSADSETIAWVQSLRELVQVGLEDQEFSVPEATVRVVKSFGAALPRPEVAENDRFRLPLKALFDSWVDLAPAGARDLAPSLRLDRQVSFQAGPYTLDLRFEQDPERRKAVVVGQLIRETAEVQPLAEVPALLTAGDELVDSATTSELGEFELQGKLGRPLVLSLFVDAQDCIEVPLSGTFAAGDDRR